MKALFSLLCAAFFNLSTASSQIIPSGIELVDTGISVNNNVGVRHAGDGSGRLFLIDQNGLIRIVDAQGNLLTTPFLDIEGKVDCCGERGFLGLAFHPDYETNGLFFVSYTKDASDSTNGDSIIERYQVSLDPNIADANSGIQLMRIVQDFGNHNGGNIMFGPDGYLYIGMGDGGSGNDPRDRSQTLGSALGKMLRIDVDGNTPPARFDYEFNKGALGGTPPTCPLETSNYSIPNDNPFVGNQSACAEVWAWGLRNPWRWSFDSETGDLIIGDVGQDAREEISFQPANSTGGENYGWRCREGEIATPGINCSPPNAVDPILTKEHQTPNNPVPLDDRGSSIVGGHVYRGPSPVLNGLYFFADTGTRVIWAARENNGTWTDERWNYGPGFTIVSFGEDERGNVYVSDLNGTLYRIDGPLDDLIFASGFD
ncbi:PQQ-dependent sugar dehydrogenase [Marinicella sp. W31]|uniref:PQQ-dependent sugar dehydrogenase n=1 Tax=Marinicella sp. W31 TaxID=3023713 RepID=UPI003756CB5E